MLCAFSIMSCFHTEVTIKGSLKQMGTLETFMFLVFKFQDKKLLLENTKKFPLLINLWWQHMGVPWKQNHHDWPYLSLRESKIWPVMLSPLLMVYKIFNKGIDKGWHLLRVSCEERSASNLPSCLWNSFLFTCGIHVA